MCGIAGYFALGNKRPQKNRIEKIWELAEGRGTDASGFAFKNDNEKVMCDKAPVKATELMKKSKLWGKLETKIAMPKMMILHTRHATQGSKELPLNNHPVTEKGNPFYAVHNGVITNEHEFGVKISQVDSLAVIRSLMKHEGDIEKTFSSLNGSFSVAILSDEDNLMRLFRHSNPTTIYIDIEDDIFYFASLESYLEDTFKDLSTEKKWGFSFTNNRFRIVTYKDEQALILDESGLKEKFTCKYVYKASTKTQIYSNYKGRGGAWNWDDYEVEEVSEDLGAGQWIHEGHIYKTGAGKIGYVDKNGTRVYYFSKYADEIKALEASKSDDIKISGLITSPAKVTTNLTDAEKEAANKDIKDELEFVRSKLNYTLFDVANCSDCDYIFIYNTQEPEQACPYCGRVHPIIKGILDNQKQRVK